MAEVVSWSSTGVSGLWAQEGQPQQNWKLTERDSLPCRSPTFIPGIPAMGWQGAGGRHRGRTCLGTGSQVGLCHFPGCQYGRVTTLNNQIRCQHRWSRSPRTMMPIKSLEQKYDPVQGREGEKGSPQFVSLEA